MAWWDLKGVVVGMCMLLTPAFALAARGIEVTRVFLFPSWRARAERRNAPTGGRAVILARLGLKLFAIALAGILAVAPAGRSFAVGGPGDEIFKHYDQGAVVDWWKFKLGLPMSPAAAGPAPSVAKAATFRFNNTGSVDQANEPGEPNEGGKMKKTLWAKLRLPTKSRVVIHTFGSDFDTVLAVYTGSAVNHLTKVASNDDRLVPGVSGIHSLVRFDAKANVEYSIQIGSKTGAEGDVYLNAFVFPPGGGIFAYLVSVAGAPFQGQDYACCGDPKFIVHNSTDDPTTVSATHGLGAGIVPPAPLDLGRGVLKTAAFTFTSGFDRTTPRTRASTFTLTARKGPDTVSIARVRGLIAITGASPPNVLTARVSPHVRAGELNEPLEFRATLTNGGAQPATGCHFRSRALSRLKTRWQRINPNNGASIGGLNLPATIPAHQTQTFKVWVASQQSTIADPTFADATEVEIGCANTAPAEINLRNSFDVTARGAYNPAEVSVTSASPPGDVLNVPAGGTAVFTATAVNTGPAATMIARPQYAHPFDEPSSKQFTVKVCRVNGSGVCIAAPDFSVQYSAAKGVANTFKVFVKAPALNPGFDPTKRRVLLIFAQVQPVGFTFSVPVGARSIAVRRN